MYYAIFSEMKRMLVHLDKWLDAAGAFAQSKSFDSKVYLGLRLAPDQLPFSKQVQIACDTFKISLARMTGKEAPVHADNEQTLEELRARVQSVLGYFEGFSEKDFEGADARVISQPRWEGKVMNGRHYFLEHALPNFFFHVTHTYALLRHSGVSLGKSDYLGPLSLRTP